MFNIERGNILLTQLCIVGKIRVFVGRAFLKICYWRQEENRAPDIEMIEIQRYRPEIQPSTCKTFRWLRQGKNQRVWHSVILMSNKLIILRHWTSNSCKQHNCQVKLVAFYFFPQCEWRNILIYCILRLLKMIQIN